MKAKIFSTRKLSDSVMKHLEDHCDLSVNDRDEKLSEEQIIKGVQGKDGLICLLNDQITKRILESNPELKVIANFGVGYNNIDIETAAELGIMVANTPGVLDETTAELTFALIMSVSRRVVEGDRYIRKGKWKTGWEIDLFQGFDLHHKTLGIIGFGRIGQALAKIARGFDMNILYHSRNRVESHVEDKYQARYMDKDTLLSQSDIVSLHTPLTQETRHLMSKRELALMKKTAILINTARGEIVDENALYEALKSKNIWGAGLDVFEEEPKIVSGLLGLKNVVLLPHIGSASVETRSTMARMVADNLIAGVTGKVPTNLVNNAVLQRPSKNG